jgi:hypothetical protein
MVVLPGVSSREVVATACAKVAARLGEPVTIGAVRLPRTAHRLGGAVAPADGQSPRDVSGSPGAPADRRLSGHIGCSRGSDA